MPTEDCCETKLDKELPATSPSVYASPYAANVILDKPLVPERFGATPAIMEGLADATMVVQRMLDASQAAEKDKLKPLEFGSCRLVLEGSAEVTMGNYSGSGLTIRGGGNNITKLIAHPDNADGLIKIVRSHNMERVQVTDVSFISRLLQQTDNTVMNGINPGYATAALNKNNGIALWIAGPTPGDGIYGLEDDTTVIVDRCSWHGEGENASETHFNGVWHRALQIDGAWFALVQNNHFAGLGDFNSAMGFVNGNNEHAVLMNHCYAPEVAGNKFNGTWTTGFELRGLEAGNDIGERFEQRFEGGRIRHNIFGGFSKDAVVVSHNYGLGSLQAPGFQILDNHINFRRFGVVINGHRQIETTSNEFYAANVPAPFGEALPAAYKLSDCGDFDSVNDAFLEAGWYQNEDSAFVCYRLEDKIQGFKAAAPRFNCGGIGVRIGPDAGPPGEGDQVGTTRSIQILDAVEGGRRAFNLWGAAFQKYVDRSGKGVIYWESAEQSYFDHKRFISNAADPTNVISSPVLSIDRDRQDFATESAPKIGYLTQRFRKSNGDWADAAILAGKCEDNTDGALKTGFDLYAYSANNLTNVLSYSGAQGVLNVNAGQVIQTATNANILGRPRHELYRHRPDYATNPAGTLAEYAVTGLNSAGQKVAATGVETAFVNNTAGLESTKAIFYARHNGGVSLPMTIDGDHVVIPNLWVGSAVAVGGSPPVKGKLQVRDQLGNIVNLAIVD